MKPSVKKTIQVAELPPCDICIGAVIGLHNLQNDSSDPVRYDTLTTHGAWGHVCPRHWKSSGVGPATKLTKGGVQ